MGSKLGGMEWKRYGNFMNEIVDEKIEWVWEIEKKRNGKKVCSKGSRFLRNGEGMERQRNRKIEPKNDTSKWIWEWNETVFFFLPLKKKSPPMKIFSCTPLKSRSSP